MTDLSDQLQRLLDQDEASKVFDIRRATIVEIIDAIRAAEDRGIQIGLRAAAEAVETQGDSTATDALSVRLCCNGHMCGCRGATVEEWLTYIIRAITPAEARKIGGGE